MTSTADTIASFDKHLVDHRDRITTAQALIEKIQTGSESERSSLFFPLDQLDHPNYLQSSFFWRQKKKPHEDEFNILRFFSDYTGEILDVGANIGYSLFSIRCFNTKAKVISIEPLPFLESALAYQKRKEGDRFEYHMIGAGDTESEMAIYFPVLGRRPFSALARLDLDAFKNEYCLVQPYVAQPDSEDDIRVCHANIKVIPLDTLNTNPFFIKLDVELHEAAALRGLKATIQRNNPLIMLELGNFDPNVDVFLRELGYLFADYHDGYLLETEERSRSVNGFYFHKSRQEEYEKLGLFTPCEPIEVTTKMGKLAHAVRLLVPDSLYRFIPEKLRHKMISGLNLSKTEYNKVTPSNKPVE